MRTTRTHSNIAIFCGQFGTGLLHVVFSFYYVKVFLNIFHVGEYWFNIAQFLFMFWNAINDPLFGYIQDIGESWMTNRLKVFSFLGPLMSLSFLVLWFPWGSSPPYLEGLHLIVALFLYDAFFSCIGVAWSALFTESTRNHSRRVSGLKYAQMASLISSNIIALIERFSHSLDNFHEFQTLCMIIAGIATLCFFVTAHYGSMRGVLTRNRRQRAVDDRSSTAIEELAKGDLLLLGASLVNDADSSSDSEDERDRAKTKFEAALDGGVASIGDGDSKRAARPTGAIELASSRTLASSASAPTAFWREIVTVSREIIAASDFWRVVLTNFIHTCRSVLQLNFASIIVDLLIPQEILPKGSWQLSAFFAVCTALPQLLFVVNERLLLRLGAYGVFMRGFYVSIASSMALYFFAAAGNPYIIMLFIVVDTIAIHATSPLFNILFAEFVEDDALRNKRRQTMSSLIFSLNALIVKPSISITPVIAVYLMNRSGYELYRSNGERTPELIACGLRFTFWAPLFLAALEVLTLGGYSLRADFRTSSSGAADKPRRGLIHKL